MLYFLADDLQRVELSFVVVVFLSHSIDRSKGSFAELIEQLVFGLEDGIVVETRVTDVPSGEQRLARASGHREERGTKATQALDREEEMEKRSVLIAGE